MIFTVVIELRRFDRIWFNSRAVAETVKKETWFFMMKVKPYGESVSEPGARKGFLDFLNQILRSQPLPWSELTHHHPEGSQISPRMEKTRKGTTAERLEYYTKNRIHEQQVWYSTKSKSDRAREFQLSIVIWILQAIAVILAFTNVIFRGLPVNLVGVATTAGASVLLWNNARSYRELSQSYGLIAQELSIFEEQAKQISTEKELAEIILNVEAAISQEHTIWKVKRLATT